MREAGIDPDSAVTTVEPVVEPVVATRAAARRGATANPTVEPLSRAEARERQRVATKAKNPIRALLMTWWVYPLLAGIAVCVYMGAQNAGTPLPSNRPIVVVTPSPVP